MSKRILIAKGPTLETSGIKLADLRNAVLVYFPKPDGSAVLIKHRFGPAKHASAEELKEAIEFVKTKYPEPEYPPYAKTLDEAIAELKRLFGHPNFRVVEYRLVAVTSGNDKLNYHWSAKNQAAAQAAKLAGKK